MSVLCMTAPWAHGACEYDDCCCLCHESIHALENALGDWLALRETVKEGKYGPPALVEAVG